MTVELEHKPYILKINGTKVTISHEDARTLLNLLKNELEPRSYWWQPYYHPWATYCSDKNGTVADNLTGTTYDSQDITLTKGE